MSALRKAFEQWRSEGGKYPNTIKRIGNEGAYRYQDTCTAWAAWQAATRWYAALPAAGALSCDSVLKVLAAKDARIRELTERVRALEGQA